MSLQSKLKFITWTDISAYDQGYKSYLVNAHELRIKNDVADLYSKLKEKNKNQLDFILFNKIHNVFINFIFFNEK
jgi:hypothetical protein